MVANQTVGVARQGSPHPRLFKGYPSGRTAKRWTQTNRSNTRLIQQERLPPLGEFSGGFTPALGNVLPRPVLLDRIHGGLIQHQPVEFDQVKLLGIEPVQGVAQGQAELHGAQGGAVGDHEAQAPALLLFEHAGGGREPLRNEANAGQALAVHFGSELQVIHIGCA